MNEVLPPRTRLYISTGVFLVSLAGIMGSEYLERAFPAELPETAGSSQNLSS
jgi:hypothetical protein